MDLISRQALCEYALNQKDKSVTPNDIMRFPSAQPKIIRCRDCKHYEGGWYCSAWNNSPGFPMGTEEGYCNLAEMRTDEGET